MGTYVLEQSLQGGHGMACSGEQYTEPNRPYQDTSNVGAILCLHSGHIEYRFLRLGKGPVLVLVTVASPLVRDNTRTCITIIRTEADWLPVYDRRVLVRQAGVLKIMRALGLVGCPELVRIAVAGPGNDVCPPGPGSIPYSKAVTPI